MALAYGLQQLVDNVGMSFEWIVVLILILAAVIIAAKQFQISMLVLMATMGGCFVWFYEKGYNWTLPLVVMLMSLVILALSLYATSATSQTGGYT